MLTINYKL